MEGGIDPSNPESIQQLLGSGVLEPEETPEQQMALRRLETLLALVEGWVDTVVAEAAKDRLPGHSALAETMRRRRATGGPAEQTFATLVGLELRPRRLRDAATVWGAMAQRTAAPSATGSGRTPTCCRRRTTSTSRWTSWPGRAWTTSSPR